MFTCPIGESYMILSLHEFKKLEMQLSNSPAKKKKKKNIYKMSYCCCGTF
jgi:hypothetical protein